MTRKDYVLIAEILQAQKPGFDDYSRAEYEAWEATALAFATALHTTNAAFNAKRFLEACGCK